MNLENKCICPYEDDGNTIANEADYLTLDQAAAVAAGYQPCCAFAVKSREFIHCNPDKAEEVNLFLQKLSQEVACGNLKSKRSRLNRAEHLLDRNELEKWLIDWKMRRGLINEVSTSKEQLVLQRARAIRELIKTRGWNSKKITVLQKKTLRLELENRHDGLDFTKSTFAKAWTRGGKLDWWSIEDKQKFTKHQRHSQKGQLKKS